MSNNTPKKTRKPYLKQGIRETLAEMFFVSKDTIDKRIKNGDPDVIAAAAKLTLEHQKKEKRARIQAAAILGKDLD